MLTEEALVLIGAVVAAALLILGVLELIAPSRPKHPRRRGQASRDPWRRARTGAAPTRSRAEAQAIREAPVGRSPLLRRAPLERPIPSRPVPDIAALWSKASGVAEAPARRPEREFPAAAPAPIDSVLEPEPEVVGSAVEHCYALYEAQQFTEVVTAASSALEGGRVADDEDVARLWGVVGLARQALGEAGPARAAFEAAIAAAPRDERATWERHLIALALRVGRDRSEWAQNPSLADSGERLGALNEAIDWLGRGLEIAPEDETLSAAEAAAREARWPVYERVALELIQRQEYERARHVLKEALAASPAPPGELETSMRDLLSSTYGGEVGQLTAEALRRMRDGKETEALATLEKAEELLGAIPEDGLPERRRQELERRLWWSYTKVGIRWLEGGMYEEALSPLLHALRFASVGPNRLEETRRPLARALENLIDSWQAMVERLAHEGSRHEAEVLCDRLWGFIHDARASGMSEEELAGVMVNTRALSRRLGLVR